MRVRFPYTARYDSMPVGSSRRDVMTMRFVSDDPRLRLFDGHADIAGAHHSRMMRTAPVGGVGANPISLSAQCGKGSLERGRPRFLSADPQDVGTVSAEHGSSAPVIPVMPHAAVCASTASMSARIRHEWPDRLWTVRILRPRKGGIRTCFRSPTGRGNSLRNCPVRVRIPAKALAETQASTPPISVSDSCLHGNDTLEDLP